MTTAPSQMKNLSGRVRAESVTSCLPSERILDMSRDYLNGLNKEQRGAVKHGDTDKLVLSGPLLVIAGAGSGKTKTLAHRVAHLIVKGVDPHRILLLTFSRRAANEMTRRVEKITAIVLGAERCELPWSGTFHAIGAQFARAGA